MSWKNLLACMRTAAQAVGWLMLNFTNNLSYGIASASPVHSCGSENTEKLDRLLVLSLFEKDTSRHTRPDPKHDSAYALILYYIPKASQKSRQFLPKNVSGNLLRYGNQWGKNHNFGILEMAGLGLVGQIGSWAWEAG